MPAIMPKTINTSKSLPCMPFDDKCLLAAS